MFETKQNSRLSKDNSGSFFMPKHNSKQETKMQNKQLDVFKCSKCGLVIEILENGMTPSCCGIEMVKQQPNTVDAAKEKHVPVAVALENGTSVKVGSVEHPMTDAHYIQWIEIVNGQWVNRYNLKPDMKPEALFHVQLKPGMIIRAFCNLHGLWEARV